MWYFVCTIPKASSSPCMLASKPEILGAGLPGVGPRAGALMPADSDSLCPRGEPLQLCLSSRVWVTRAGGVGPLHPSSCTVVSFLYLSCGKPFLLVPGRSHCYPSWSACWRRVSSGLSTPPCWPPLRKPLFS